MIRINQIKMPISHTKEELLRKTAGLLHIEKSDILSWRIVKKSVDARKKPKIYFIYTIDFRIKDEKKTVERAGNVGNSAHGRTSQVRHSGNIQIQQVEEVEYCFPKSGETPLKRRPVIIGTGPAGLFCGYLLALHGYRPILLERGKAVEERQKDVEAFWQGGALLADSNVQFGEGGAGAFSDGKLNTLVKDKKGRNQEVLRLLVHAGAPEEILYEAKPHIGTDILMRVVKNMREELMAYGGEVRFESKVTDILSGKDGLTGVVINDTERLETDIAVLAVGHSARDTFRMLSAHSVPMAAKAFAVGLRVEHPRKMINRIQYGVEESEFLPTAGYKVTAQTSNGRGVYSFCMCPGGYVVNASSEAGRLAINGMSYSGRNGSNSNSAVIVTVTPKDFEDGSPLSGVAYQQMLEEKAYALGQGKVPIETYGGFKEAVTGKKQEDSVIIQKYPEFTPQIKGGYRFAPVHEILPRPLRESFVEGMEQFGTILPGFADSGAYVSGIESRTSSPVRIWRDETGQSAIKGLYPCGEGAGYAGGITSAAMDGMLIAEKIAEKYNNLCGNRKSGGSVSAAPNLQNEKGT